MSKACWLRQSLLLAGMKDGSWIKPEYRIYDEELRYGDVLLHEDDDHSFDVAIAGAWCDNPPHDHATWVVLTTTRRRRSEYAGQLLKAAAMSLRRSLTFWVR